MQRVPRRRFTDELKVQAIALGESIGGRRVRARAGTPTHMRECGDTHPLRACEDTHPFISRVRGHPPAFACGDTHPLTH